MPRNRTYERTLMNDASIARAAAIRTARTAAFIFVNAWISECAEFAGNLSSAQFDAEMRAERNGCMLTTSEAHTLCALIGEDSFELLLEYLRTQLDHRKYAFEFNVQIYRKVADDKGPDTPAFILTTRQPALGG